MRPHSTSNRLIGATVGISRSFSSRTHAGKSENALFVCVRALCVLSVLLLWLVTPHCVYSCPCVRVCVWERPSMMCLLARVACSAARVNVCICMRHFPRVFRGSLVRSLSAVCCVERKRLFVFLFFRRAVSIVVRVDALVCIVCLFVGQHPSAVSTLETV